jgi:hypothetical protein
VPENEPEEWRERLESAVAETLRKREEKRQLRRGFDARRDVGLVRRHSQKAARADAAAVIPEADGRCRYLVSETPAHLCPNAAVPSTTLCRPHLAAAVRLAQRLGLA